MLTSSAYAALAALAGPLSAIAIACFRFRTIGPFFEPLCKVPDLNSDITLWHGNNSHAISRTNHPFRFDLN
jgi:hypothetical protein